MLKIMLTLARCSEESPTEDGKYVVVTMNSDRTKVYNHGDIDYTVAGGWNTSYGLRDHALRDMHRIRFEDTEEYPDTYWAKSTDLIDDAEVMDDEQAD